MLSYSDADGTASTITADTATVWHVLKIKRYSQTKGVVGAGTVFSRSAAFANGGHRWRIEYYPDGYNEAVDDCISFDLVLLDPPPQGDDDDGVVRARYAFSLLDRAGAPVPEYTKTGGVCAFSAAVPAWGFERFVERAELEASPHLGDDDSFSVRCDVTVYRESPAEMVIAAAPPAPSGRASSSRLRGALILCLTAVFVAYCWAMFLCV